MPLNGQTTLRIRCETTKNTDDDAVPRCSIDFYWILFSGTKIDKNFAD